MENDLTLSQTARVLGVNVVTVRRLIHAGKLDAYTIDPDARRLAYRIKLAVLEAYRDRGRVAVAGADRKQP